jgi:hypothetical protein
MHEGITVWNGCGPCGAEPDWMEIAEEMGLPMKGVDEGGTDRQKAPALSSSETTHRGD